MKRFISWNVNCLRAIRKKGFDDIFNDFNADAFCLQEIKLQEGQTDFAPEGYFSYWNYAERKGYSGTAIFSKEEAISVNYGIGEPYYDDEGRVITLEYPDYYLVTVYTPNANEDLSRLDYRCDWEDLFRKYLHSLNKPVVVCGDLNVAHQEIDLKNFKTNRGNAGFTDEERGKFTELLESGFTDTFRYLYPDLEGVYSWWSYRYKARENNAGWRIDYFLVSDTIKDKIAGAAIHMDIFGSDHCPVELILDIG